MIIVHQHHFKQVIRHATNKILRRSKAWWAARQAREQWVLKVGALVILLTALFILAEGVWMFYGSLPQKRVQWLQREWLLADVRWLMKSNASTKAVSSPVTSIAPVAGEFLTQANQLGVNGQCTSQSAGQWLCTGNAASLEAVQQWWLKGRNEGYYVEKFEAKTHSPGLVTWTMVLHR